MEGPDAPPLLLFPVQLLQRISPWFPFFHIDEEFVLQTAQHGFKPSGIVTGHKTTPGYEEMNTVTVNNEMVAARPAPANSSQITQWNVSFQWHKLRQIHPQTTGYAIRLMTVITTASNCKPDCLFSQRNPRHCWSFFFASFDIDSSSVVCGVVVKRHHWTGGHCAELNLCLLLDII